MIFLQQWPPKGGIMSFSGRFISNKSRGNLSNFSTPRVSIVHGTKLKGPWEKTAHIILNICTNTVRRRLSSCIVHIMCFFFQRSLSFEVNSFCFFCPRSTNPNAYIKKTPVQSDSFDEICNLLKLTLSKDVLS